MRRRVTRILALAWVFVWFGIVLPGHDRGAITLPTPAQAGASEEATCPLCVATGSAETDAGDDKECPAPSGACCAVCQFMATLSTPPVFVFDPPDTDLLDMLEPVQIVEWFSLSAPRIGLARGPPAA